MKWMIPVIRFWEPKYGIIIATEVYHVANVSTKRYADTIQHVVLGRTV